MTYIFNKTLDDELDRYFDAEEALSANVGTNLNNTKKVFNVASNSNEFYTKLASGGAVKVHEQPLTALEDAQMYNQSLLDNGITPTSDDFYAAGFDDAIINEGGFINVQEKSGITEPLTEEVQQQAFDLGFDVVSPVDNPVFKGSVKEITKGLARGGIKNPALFLSNALPKPESTEDQKIAENLFDLEGSFQFQIFDPETGEFDPAIKFASSDEINAQIAQIENGKRPYAVDLESLLQVDEQSGGGAQVLGTFAQFIGAYAGLGKFFRFGKSNFMKGFTGGAAADFLAFEGNEGRLSDIIYELGEAFGKEIPQNVIVDFMQTDPNDPDYVGRFKTALEGGVLTSIAEPILIGIGKTFRAIKDGDITQEQVLPFVKAATNNMQETFTNVVKDVGERLNQPGQMPPLGSNLGNVDALRREANIQRFGNDPNDPVAKVEAPTENKPGIIAFHGSGADFNEFKLEKIGTGEGNQAFGYGLYFSDVEDIAEYYRALLDFNNNMKGKRIKYKGEIFEDLGDTPAAEAAPPSYMAITNIAEEMNKYLPANPKLATATAAKERLLKRIDAEIEKNKNLNAVNNKRERTELRDGQTLEELLIKEAEIRKQALIDINPDDIAIERGKVFKVKLDVTPDKLLDYDKPLGEQNDFIKERLQKLVEAELNEDDAANLGFEGLEINKAKANMLNENRSVVSFLNDWAVFRGYDSAAEELLDKYGIKGIKYLENSSRNTSGGNLIDVSKTDDGFRAKVAVENRQGGVGGSGRIVTTSPPYKTEEQARDWADQAINKADNNYVIFDEKLINIMKKYGIAAPVAVSSMAVKSSDQEDET